MLSKMGKVDAQMNKIYYAVAKLVNLAKDLQEEYPLLNTETLIVDQIIKESSSYMDLLHVRETNIIERIEMRRMARPGASIQSEIDYTTGEVNETPESNDVD